MNQAVFCVTPNARASSQELIPFLELASIQTAGSHFVSGKGLSSKIVPTFAVNCFLQSLHCQRSRPAVNHTATEPQLGQATPFGQRRDTIASCAFFGSAK